MQDGVVMENESADVAGNSSTVQLNDAVNETTNHPQSTDHNQCVVLSDSIFLLCCTNTVLFFDFAIGIILLICYLYYW